MKSKVFIILIYNRTLSSLKPILKKKLTTHLIAKIRKIKSQLHSYLLKSSNTSIRSLNRKAFPFSSS